MISQPLKYIRRELLAHFLIEKVQSEPLIVGLITVLKSLLSNVLQGFNRAQTLVAHIMKPIKPPHTTSTPFQNVNRVKKVG